MPAEFEAALAEPPASVLLAVRAADDSEVTVTEALAMLRRSALDIVDAAPTGEYTTARAHWELEVSARYEGDEAPTDYRVWLEAAPHAESELLAGIDWRGVLPEDADATARAGWTVGVSTLLGEQPLLAYHRQVQLLATIAPDAVLAFDVNAVTPHPARWLREIAEARTPPSPATLFSIHSVFDQEAGGGVWLHSHGLLRCGSIDLEMLDIPEAGAGLMGQLLNTVAAMFIEGGVPEPDDAFEPGQNMELVWLPWDRGVDKAPRHGLGSRSDRDDEHHTGTRGILFAPVRGLLGGRKYRSPAMHLPQMGDNPLLFVSRMETERMALLAAERLDQFCALHARFGTRDDWLFLVKLGYDVDEAEPGETEREHLWFVVHAVDGERVDATLANQPYAIAAMSEGDRGDHSLSHLSDWAILCEHGRFDADNVGELQRSLAASE